MQQVGVKYYKYKKIYLVVTDSVIQANGVLFGGRAEAKETANDLNVTKNIIERKYPLLRYLEVYETLIMTNCKRTVAIRIHLAMYVCVCVCVCVKLVKAHLNLSNFRYFLEITYESKVP